MDYMPTDILGNIYFKDGEFNKAKDGFLGYSSNCRVCSKESWKEYYSTPEYRIGLLISGQ